MPSLNEATIMGHLGRDPEMRFTSTGKGVCNFSVATTSKWGEKESTEWHRIVVWDNEKNPQATRCAEILAKGKLVYVKGRLQTREWQDKQGAKQRTTEIVANTVLFLDRPEGKKQITRPGDDEIPF